jgi:F-box/leucine-rich repeat protein 14
VSGLTALTTLKLYNCNNVSTEGLCTVSRLTALTSLDLSCNPNVTTEVLRAVSRLNALTRVRLSYCDNVTDEGLLELRSLAALTTLLLYGCPHVTDAGKQALRTALPNLTIEGRWAVGQAAAMPPFSPCLPARSTQCPHAEEPPVVYSRVSSAAIQHRTA